MSIYDALVAPAWTAVNMLLVAAMWRAAHRISPRTAFFERLRHTLVLCAACVVGTGTALGAVGVLSAASLLGVVAVAALSILFALRKRVSSIPGRSLLRTTEDGDATGAIAKRLSRVESWCLVGWTIWIALCAGRVVVSGLLEYPSNWDTLTYHLSAVDQWLSSGNLYAPGAARWFFPGNNELVALWMVAPFSGDFFAPLNNFPWVVLLLLAGIELGRIYGLAPLARHLGALALVSTYVLWHQIMDNKNDVAAVSLLFTCLVYAFHYIADSRRADLILASVCLGLLAGVKYYALTYAGIAFIVIVALTASSLGKREALFAAAICLVGLVVFGGYWYARNLWVSGMPLYPKPLLPGIESHSGVSPDLWSSTLLGNPSQEKWHLWLRALWRMTGPCHLASLILGPASLLWLFFTGVSLRRTEGSKTQGSLRMALVAMTLGSLALYAITPFTMEGNPGTLRAVKSGYVTIRLGLCFLSLTLMCAIILFNDTLVLLGRRGVKRGLEPPHCDTCPTIPRLRSRVSRAMSFAFIGMGIAAVAYQVCVEHRLAGAPFVIDRKLSAHFLPSVLVAEWLLILGILGWECRRLFSRRVHLARVLFMAGTIGVASIAAGLLGERWHSGFASHYDAFFGTDIFSFLEKHERDSTSICALMQRSCPFAGSRRQFLLSQVHYAPAQPDRFPSVQGLLEFIYERRATLVAAYPGSREWQAYEMDAWIDRHPGVFVVIRESGGMQLLRVNSVLLAEALGCSNAGRSLARSDVEK